MKQSSTSTSHTTKRDFEKLNPMPDFKDLLEAIETARQYGTEFSHKELGIPRHSSVRSN